MIKVYGNPRSAATQKVLTTLAEKGQPHEFVLVDLSKGEHKAPAYMQKHPFGVIPVIEDDGFTMYEARAIIRYLDRKLPGPALTPGDAASLGRMEQWMSVEHCYLSPNVMGIAFELIIKALMRPGSSPDMDKVNASREQVIRPLEVADRALMSQAYLAGDTFSLADISWMPYLRYLSLTPHGSLIAERPHLSAWWRRVSARPSWQKVTRPS